MQIRFAVAALIFVVGCSAAPEDQVGASRAALDSEAVDFEAVDYEHPLYLQTQAGAQCSFHPQGAKSPSGDVAADVSENKVRFFAPPSSWGTILEVNCAAGSYSQDYVVNLKDPSTYQSEPELLKKGSTSVRPALAGDLLAISADEILNQGYPPRPPPSSPAYQRWVSTVTAPRTIQHLTYVAALGRYGSNYKGSYNMTENSAGNPAWTGRIYDSAGWTSGSPVTTSTFAYTEYALYMTVPFNYADCPTGQVCSMFMWGGLGGYNDVNGSRAGLIQSGVVMQNKNAATVAIEYFPASWLAGVGTISILPGDTLLVWGWSSNSSACNTGMAQGGAFGCFNFYNERTGVYLQSNQAAQSITKPVRSPTVILTAATFESIAEKNSIGAQQTDYGSSSIQDWAFDYNGIYHDVTTDPWIFIEGYSSLNNQVSQAYYPGFTNNNDLASFAVQWLRFQ